MSTLSFPQKSRTRWITLSILAGTLIIISGFLIPRFLRRPVPVVASTATTVVQPAVLNGTGKAGDLVITEEAMELAEIKVASTQKRLISEKLVISGNIEPGGNSVAKITPRVPGKITSLSVVVGDTVRAGQTLGIIESSQLAQAQAAYRQATTRLAAQQNNLLRQQKLARLGQFSQPQVEQARIRSVDVEQQIQEAGRRLQAQKAELTEAESQRRALQAILQQAEAQVGVVKSRLNRAESLYKEELLSRQDFEQAQADYQKAQSDLEVARVNAAQGESHIQSTKTQVTAAEGEYELAQKRARITSASLAREENVYKGRFLASKETVEAEASVAQARLDVRAAAQAVELLGGTPGGGNTVALISPIAGRIQERNVSLGETVDTEHTVYTVINLDVLWAQLAVSPGNLGTVRPGQRVELTSETTPGRVFTGTISTIGSAADETTRAVPVRVALENRDGLLRPGVFVRGTIVTDVRRERVVVPQQAIQEHTGKKTVYIAKEGIPGAFEVRHVKVGIGGKDWREITSDLKAGEKIAVSGTFYLKSEALKSSLSDGCCAPGGK